MSELDRWIRAGGVVLFGLSGIWFPWTVEHAVVMIGTILLASKLKDCIA